MQGITVGRICTFLFLFWKITTLFSLNLKVSKWNACPPKDSLYLVLLDIPVDQCVYECTRRPSCNVIGYKTPIQFCELHANSTTADIRDSQCFIIRREDMTADQKCGCADWEVCLKDQNTCSRKECPVLESLQHGRYLGNVKRIGARKRVLCDNCYTLQGDNNELECMENGKWSQNITCNLIDCGELPTVDNGQLTPDMSGNTTCGATATLSCDPGYVSSKDKISCQFSAKWQEAVCYIVDCGSLPSICKGFLTLDTPRLTTYRATATVSCDVGYQPSHSTSLCMASGVWQTVTCILVVVLLMTMMMMFILHRNIEYTTVYFYEPPT